MRDLVAREARGDARRALTTLEAAAAVAVPDAAGRSAITPAVIEEAAQQKTILYDKAGDEHYGVVSAFIKSLRGSDPDAAVYWMARMIEAGEDPLFVLRRMVIFAAEDVGVADPRALPVATAALDAFRFVGLPEGLLPMTEAVALPRDGAQDQHRAHHLRRRQGRRRRARRAAGPGPPAQRAHAARQGSSAGAPAYQYPHDFAGHHVREEYLPEEIRGHRYYAPSDSGDEREIAERLARLRDDQTNNEKK